MGDRRDREEQEVVTRSSFSHTEREDCCPRVNLSHVCNCFLFIGFFLCLFTSPPSAFSGFNGALCRNLLSFPMSLDAHCVPGTVAGARN